MDRLGRHVEDQLSRLSPPGTGDMVAIVRAWPDIVGEANARKSWPARLARDGTLHVHAVDSVWAFQLGMLGETILERLRENLGERTPPALRFVPGPVPEPPAAAAGDRGPQAVSPTTDDLARAEAAVASIDDKELRETIARAAAASLARARLEARSDRGF